MVVSAKRAVEGIKAYIDEHGSEYGDWYAGITSDARKRLFEEHGVREKGDQWIYQVVPTTEDARTVEDYLVDTLGTDGGPGGGDEQSTMVYCYKKKRHTDP
jgi:hypothetical protein